MKPINRDAGRGVSKLDFDGILTPKGLPKMDEAGGNRTPKVATEAAPETVDGSAYCPPGFAYGGWHEVGQTRHHLFLSGKGELHRCSVSVASGAESERAALRLFRDLLSPSTFAEWLEFFAAESVKPALFGAVSRRRGSS